MDKVQSVCTFVLAIDNILLVVFDAPGVHQLSLAPGHQHDAALVLQSPHKGVPTHLPQPTPAAQVPHQLQPTNTSLQCTKLQLLKLIPVAILPDKRVIALPAAQDAVDRI